jgi:hypothetical protein
MADEGMVNIGQLARERHKAEGVVLVGFGTHQGGVIAATGWGEPMRRTPVSPARRGSWEHVLHLAGGDDKLLLFGGVVSDLLREPRGQRTIGMAYRPEYEQHGNYVPTVLPRPGSRADGYAARLPDPCHASVPVRMQPPIDEYAHPTDPFGIGPHRTRRCSTIRCRKKPRNRATSCGFWCVRPGLTPELPKNPLWNCGPKKVC